ncbi:MAG: histidine kinase [Spirochaetales bacterium]|nr:histidine kinase [Spirochaetales bacterium]
MKLRYKLLFLMCLYLLGIGVITGLSFAGWWQERGIHDSIGLGEELQIKSKNIQSLMKDIVFDLFAPRMYGQLRSLTYSPRSAVTMRQWQQAVYEYEETFQEFMALDFFMRSKDPLIRDQYLTAITMNERAMGMLSRMEEILVILKEKNRTTENLYSEMQKDQSLIPFFEEFQETSYYFTNSFEGFMEYFTRTLQENGNRIRFRIYIVFVVTVVIIIIVYIGLTLWLTRQLAGRLLHIERTFRRVSHGDFSVRLNILEKDEFGELSTNFNHLIEDLKNNVDSILNLTRDVSSWISDKSSLDDLIALICRAVVQDTMADMSVFYRIDENKTYIPYHVEGAELKEEELFALGSFLAMRVFRHDGHLFIKNTESLSEFENISSLMVVPLVVEGTPFGLLASMRTSPGEHFSDLGVTRFATFAQYSSLTIDNFFKYNELLEIREARYLALQAQVQPHFIFNVLNGFVGLNRMENRTSLEKAILALKDMLRYIQGQTTMVTLEEELLFVEKYCSLQKIRFSDRLEYKIVRDDDTAFVQIPRLLLQPLVENAIIHGIEPLERTGHLQIICKAIRRRGKAGIDIVISDDGAGFDPEAQDHNENIGLRNFRQRMVASLPDSSFLISSTPGEGTRIEIKI